MSLLTALNTGVSGLRTFGDSLQVISDNIANVSTTGYKSSRSEFADLISQTINGASGSSQLGRGVALDNISTSFAQGSLSSTDNLTDLAINGNGFFVVQKDNINYYTRNGAFSINNNGELVNSAGMNVIGYQYDTRGESLGTLGVLQFANNTIAPVMTGDGTNGTGVNIAANLDSSSDVTTFNVANPANTSNFSTTINVYDSLGSSHTLHVYFNKTASNAWAWHGVMDGGELSGGSAGTNVECASGTLTFNSSGALQSQTTTTSSFNFTGTAQTIGFNFGDPIASGGSGLGGTTQFSSASAISSQSQNGMPAGILSSVQVDTDGTVSGVYSNGSTVAIGQIALANFTNLNGLYKAGSGLYQDTLASGQAVIGRADAGGLGTISSYSLEQSNVDLAKEFVDMISIQRAYQANSRTITVGNDMLNDLINIIR
ncbi:flagellar basal-body rod protein FlgF [bacterium]|nr:flagellar basal-body rod protein FlgF [bacterium]